MGAKQFGLACGIAVALAVPATAQVGTIELELNAVADVAGGCRVTYVATNATQVALEKVSYEVAVFDTDAIVRQLLVLDFGWMPSGKTRVVQFDLPDQQCSGISRISVNAAVECAAAQGEQTLCRDNQLLSSRVPSIQFN